MAANINDKITNTSSGVRPVSTTVSTIRNLGATTLACADLTGWTTDTAVHFVTYQIDGTGDIVPGSQTDWKGIVSGSDINSLTVTGGADAGNSVGDIVEMLPTARWGKDLTDALRVSFDQDGTLKAGAVDVAGVLASNVVTTAKIADGSITNAKLSTATGELGGVWNTWSPTVVGFSALPSGAVYRYTNVGKTYTVAISMPNNGTSNATTFTISLPVAAANVVGMAWHTAVAQFVNNGSVPTTPGLAVISGGSSVISLTTNSTGAGWTASGGKRITSLVMTYEVD